MPELAYPLEGRRMPRPDSFRPAVGIWADKLARVIQTLLRRFPAVGAWWRGVDPDALFEAVDPEVWAGRPLTTLVACREAVAADRRANFDAALKVVNLMVEGGVPGDVLDALLAADALDDWPTYLTRLVDFLTRGGPREGGTAPCSTGRAAPEDAVPWPEYMSAGDLAGRLGLPPEATRKKLERLAERFDCFIENESPRKNEARRLYRVADVLPHLS
jgi:hypothetical protein